MRDRRGKGVRVPWTEARPLRSQQVGRRKALRCTTVFAAGLLALVATVVRAQETVHWHGYAQIRYGRDNPADGFSLRRGKLWVGGAVPGLPGLSFKVQGIFRNASQGAFVLQDLFAEYRTGWGKVEVGQLIPDFSLQRSQPDFLVPLVERAQVVDALIPAARTLARDIGIQTVIAPTASALRLSLGLFNGSGANRFTAAEGDFLATGRLTLRRELGHRIWAALGASGAWRRTGCPLGSGSQAGHEGLGDPGGVPSGSPRRR